MSAAMVILAAGMGNRFGGPKQLVPIGPNGESILDYNVHDAIEAGFDRVVVVTRRELLKGVERVIERTVGSDTDVRIVFQQIPADRTKPYGTADAVVTAAEHIDGAFGVSNSDDLYGPESFVALATHIRNDPQHAAIVGFTLADTVPDDGAVSRALLQTDGVNVQRVREVHGIRRADDRYEPRHVEGVGALTGGELVSMNLLALPFAMIGDLRAAVDEFVAGGAEGGVYLPEVLAASVDRGRVSVRLVRTEATWAGMTNAEDLEVVRRHAQARGPVVRP